MRPGSSTSLPQAPDDDVKHGALGHLSADEELQQAVCEALIDDAQLDSSDICVRVAQDTVVLSGSVGSREAWRRALLGLQDGFGRPALRRGLIAALRFSIDG